VKAESGGGNDENHDGNHDVDGSSECVRGSGQNAESTVHVYVTFEASVAGPLTVGPVLRLKLWRPPA
jgi:hypothetical protein